MMNTNRNISDNGVNERDSQADQLSPGSGFVVHQANQGRHQATGTNTERAETTGRKKEWKRDDCIMLIECYFMSSPERRGKMKRFHEINLETRFDKDLTPQNITDQARFIKKKGTVLSELELEEIRRRVEGEGNDNIQVVTEQCQDQGENIDIIDRREIENVDRGNEINKEETTDEEHLREELMIMLRNCKHQERDISKR